MPPRLPSSTTSARRNCDATRRAKIACPRTSYTPSAIMTNGAAKTRRTLAAPSRGGTLTKMTMTSDRRQGQGGDKHHNEPLSPHFPFNTRGFLHRRQGDNHFSYLICESI